MFLKMRLLLIVALFLTVSAGALQAQTAPAPGEKPANEPVRKIDIQIPGADLDKVTDKFGELEGTEWTETNSPDGWITTYRFEAGGILAYRNRGGSYKNGTWRREGNKIYAETNKKYCEYDMTITKNREVIEGSAHNVTGAKWTFKLVRYQRPE